MNRRLSASASGFLNYYEDDVATRSVMYLLRVRIRYPTETHVNLCDMVPSVSRRSVEVSSLSPIQQDMVTRMKMKPCTKTPIMVSDLLVQETTVTLEYLSLLLKLGVCLESVLGGMSGYAAPIFEEPVTKMLKLKSSAKTPYFRQLSKLLLNSSYGYCLLNPAAYLQQRIVIGSRSMIRCASNPNLKKFRLLGDDVMMASLAKQSVRFHSAYFVGVVIMNHSKEAFLRDFYMGMKPILERGLEGRFDSLEVNVLYVDTDSITLEIVSPSYDQCGVHLRVNDIYWSLREYVDFSPFLKQSTNAFWTEIRRRLTPGKFLAFVRRVKQFSGYEGMWKIEHIIGAHSQAISVFYTIRTKVYLSICFVRADAKEPGVESLKTTLKGALLKSRSSTFGLEDYLRMGDAREMPILETSMPKLTSKHWRLYFISLGRHRPTVFDRKRYLLDAESGISVPHGFLAE